MGSRPPGRQSPQARARAGSWREELGFILARWQFPRPATAVARLPLSCEGPAAAASGPRGRLHMAPTPPAQRWQWLLRSLQVATRSSTAHCRHWQCPSRPVKLRIKLPRAMRLHRPGAGGELPPLASRSHEKNRRMLGLSLVVVKNRIEQLEYIFAITLNSCIL